jgi:hypothetical protein
MARVPITINFNDDHVSGIPVTGGVAATATITFTGTCTLNETIKIEAADGTTKTFTAKAATSAGSGEFARAFGSNANASGLGDCLTNAAGMQGKISVSRDGAVLTLTQVVLGNNGNTAIVEGLTNATATSFTGGSNYAEGTPSLPDSTNFNSGEVTDSDLFDKGYGQHGGTNARRLRLRNLAII